MLKDFNRYLEWLSDNNPALYVITLSIMIIGGFFILIGGLAFYPITTFSTLPIALGYVTSKKYKEFKESVKDE